MTGNLGDTRFEEVENEILMRRIKKLIDEKFSVLESRIEELENESRIRQEYEDEMNYG